jgi:uroporphyrinogen decarboxylase
MNKRERIVGMLSGQDKSGYVPAAFFLHFPPDCHEGPAAVNKHLEFFNHTDMDMVKIQYERTFPARPEIVRPADWAKLPVYDEDFFAGQLGVVKGLVEAAKHEAMVIVTLYSPFMCAVHTSRTGDPYSEAGRIMAHMVEDPEAAKVGMQRITDSLMVFVNACIKLGVDGFYHSTQGGEAHRFADRGVFAECVKPYDLAVMEEINSRCAFNILHVCDYTMEYDDLTPFLDYPGDVVNASLKLTTGDLTGDQVARMFGRPFMGGLERKGAILRGSQEDIRLAVATAIATAPEHFILGADCTIPSEVNWGNLRYAIALAHAGRQ